MQIYLKSIHTIRAENLHMRKAPFDKYYKAMRAGIDAEESKALALARQHSVNGCFAVCREEDKNFLKTYYLISPDIETGEWRSTSYDSKGFPIGHHVDKWEALVLETVKHGRSFVSDIPVADYSTDPKEIILARYDTPEEQENDFLTLLLFWHMSHSQIQQNRKQ